MNALKINQRGAALLIILLVLVIGVSALFVTTLTKNSQQRARDKVTTDALAQAKAALIGYAVQVDLKGSPCDTNCRRPGDLPCPDTDNNGEADPSCGDEDGGEQSRLGRLPWKSLNLPDLRDGNGERLWYAVSNNFKKNPRVEPLNSDTVGTINLRDSTGAVKYDAIADNGVVALIIAPGAVLVRQDSGSPQNRSCIVDVNCDSEGRCLTGSPTCNPVNYLEIANGEDNADFIDSGTNGFIMGSVKDSRGDVILNDRILEISVQDLMPLVEKRVAGEVLKCLVDYAAKEQNKGHYPWAAELDSTLDYDDDSGVRFGRIPDTQFTRTQGDSGGAMDDSWTGSCLINSAIEWWRINNWKEMVFFSIAEPYQPMNPLTIPPTNICTTQPCLAVTPPSIASDKQVVVLVAGKTLTGQARDSNADKGNPANYLEGENNPNMPSPATPDRYTHQATTTTFNDFVTYCYGDSMGKIKCWPN